jgi:lysozyme
MALEKVTALIKEFEGFRSEAYEDGLGIPTIGYGTTHWPNGRAVKLGETVTQEQAERYLKSFIVGHILPQLQRTVPGWFDMSEGQQAALISFAYNLGPGFMSSEGFDTIHRCLANKEWDKVGDALELYCNPGSPVHLGLQRRRKAERAMWEA